MGKPKMFVKEETVKRLKTLLKRFEDDEELIESKEYQSLYVNYMNGFEKDNAESIVTLCREGKTYDEIRFIIEGGTTTMSTSKKKPNTKKENAEDNDPVEEALFMISQQKVVETEPVEVIIGDSDNEDASVNNNTIIDAEYTDVENEPVIISDMVKNKSKKDKKNLNVVKVANEKSDEDEDENDPKNWPEMAGTTKESTFLKSVNNYFSQVGTMFSRVEAKVAAEMAEQRKADAEWDKQIEADVKKYLANANA